MSLGYIIFRRPEHSYDLHGKAGCPRTALRAFDRIYAGVDRMPWFDFDELHYQSKLPPDQEMIWQRLREQRLATLPDLTAVDSHAAADGILQSLGESRTLNEICCVSARPFQKIVRAKENTLPQTTWLGVDIYVSGYGSALAQGLYIRPDLFEGSSTCLTVDGLLPDDADILSHYRRAYTERMNTHNLEIMPQNDSLWYAVKVGRVSA
jgi:hypothetical protein